MDKIWLIAVVAGVILLLVSIAADAIGVGTQPGFGFNQTAGSIFGAGLIVAGFIARRIRARKGPAAPGEAPRA